MADVAPRWVDGPEFRWNPDMPLRFEPAPKTTDKPPVRTGQSRGHLHIRLLTGLLQGLALAGLLASRDAGEALFAAILFPLLFVPPLFLLGLGRLPGRVLLPWALGVAAGLAMLGLYQHQRGAGPALALPILLAGLFLFVAQALLEARSLVPDYARLSDGAWSLAVRLAFCVLFTALAWTAMGAASGWLRSRYPGSFVHAAILALVPVAFAIASRITSRGVLRPLTNGLMLALTALLPLLAFAAGVILVAGAMMPLSLAVILAAALLLIAAVNASYGGGAARPAWRRWSEFLGALLLLPLAAAGALALGLRVLAHGWSDMRILAAAMLAMLALYALAYAAAAMISLGGGRWMARLEGANRVLALVLLALTAALAFPPLDPARLSVAAQLRRLEGGLVTPAAFDFAYLRGAGLGFGRAALSAMASDRTHPRIAEGAFLALRDAPGPATPTEIGANIQVRTPGARLPGALLERDWNGIAGAPPCLTAAAPACDAYFIDLDGDGRAEIVLTYGSDAAWWAAVMKRGAGGGWYPAARIVAPPCPGALQALKAGRFVTMPSLWRDLVAAGARLPVIRPADAQPPCPAR